MSESGVRETADTARELQRGMKAGGKLTGASREVYDALDVLVAAAERAETLKRDQSTTNYAVNKIVIDRAEAAEARAVAAEAQAETLREALAVLLPLAVRDDPWAYPDEYRAALHAAYAALAAAGAADSAEETA